MIEVGTLIRPIDIAPRTIRVVLSSPIGGKVVIVPILKYFDQPKDDDTCLIEPNELEGINEQSFARYTHTTLSDVKVLEKELRLGGLIEKVGVAPEQVVQRIVNGAEFKMKPEFLHYLKSTEDMA